MALMSLLWFLFAFSLTFGKSLGGWIGDPIEYALFLRLPKEGCMPHQVSAFDSFRSIHCRNHFDKMIVFSSS
jgi:hypothetical protein